MQTLKQKQLKTVANATKMHIIIPNQKLKKCRPVKNVPNTKPKMKNIIKKNKNIYYLLYLLYTIKN